MPETNWISLLIAALIPMLLGFMYYHKNVFGKAWMDSLGITEEDINKGNMGVIFGVSFVMSFLLAFFLLNNVNGMGQEGVYDSFKHGAFHGVLIGFLVAMPIMVTNGLFERKKWKNMIINIGYWVICLALMAGTLDAMNHWPVDFTIPQ